jgi:hypothetical protein
VTTHLVDKCQIAGTIAGFDIMCATHDQKLQQCIDHNWVAHAEDIKEIDANRRCIAQAGADLTRLRQLDDQMVVKLADSEQHRKELWEVNVRLTSEKHDLELEVRKASADAHLQWEGKVNNGSLANKAIRDSARYKARIERLQSMLGAMTTKPAAMREHGMSLIRTEELLEIRRQANQWPAPCEVCSDIGNWARYEGRPLCGRHNPKAITLSSKMPGKATLMKAEKWDQIQLALERLRTTLSRLQPLAVFPPFAANWLDQASAFMVAMSDRVNKAVALTEQHHEQAVAMSEQVQEMQAKLAARNRNLRELLQDIKFQFADDGLWLHVAGNPMSGSINLGCVTDFVRTAVTKWMKARQEALRG